MLHQIYYEDVCFNVSSMHPAIRKLTTCVKTMFMWLLHLHLLNLTIPRDVAVTHSKKWLLLLSWYCSVHTFLSEDILSPKIFIKLKSFHPFGISWYICINFLPSQLLGYSNIFFSFNLALWSTWLTIHSLDFT